ncbi:hypothetical protein K1T71_009174 [Dendrolimus kikuchii]|uniref:Uncharacterized protein n=1 Tax=Dendrolimus kikuchii TaxID=765133 RepID=A0ACC1CTZ6_9NEOP|nr:hypothetical protein K1T71_009174 [Dendrolimus kikuchii]
MSKFEDNPFSDPTIDNPFADPAVQQVARSTNNATQGLDDYNPFDSQQNATPASAQQQPSQPAIMQAVSPPISGGGYSRPTQPPQQSQAPPPNFTTADFQRRQEELERKAEELARREAELRAGSAGRRNNWPPLPAFCPIQPCFYQDINVDIPLEFQRIVRHLYHLWMFHALVLAVNIVGAISLMFADFGFTVFGLSILYFILLTPFSFICWYRPIYKAFRSDSSFNFMVFFFIFLFQIIITIVQSIGFSGGGSCGLITSIAAFQVNVAVGIITILVTIGFITCAVADIMLMAKVHRIYRSTGASLAKAQAEFTTEILRNQHVQTAASSAAAAAVNAQIANANRY